MNSSGADKWFKLGAKQKIFLVFIKNSCLKSDLSCIPPYLRAYIEFYLHAKTAIAELGNIGEYSPEQMESTHFDKSKKFLPRLYDMFVFRCGGQLDLTRDPID